VLVVAIALGTAIAVNRWLPSNASDNAQPESILHRVQRTKTLTCAYWLWPELMEKDPNTGAMKGVVVDITNEVAAALGAQVKWEEEANIDNFIQLINSGRVDALCAPMAPAVNQRALIHFSRPVFYAGFDIYVRAGDHRFDDTKQKINKPNIRFLSLDGSA